MSRTEHPRAELKTSRLTILIEPAAKAAFENACAKIDMTPSQVVRRLIKNYVAEADTGHPKKLRGR